MPDFKARNVTERIVQNLADVDFYKLTMLQFIWAHFGQTVVTFRFHNRTDVDLLEYIDPEELERQLERITQRRFPPKCARALNRLAGPLFASDFLLWLQRLRLPSPSVRVDPEAGLVVETTGSWAQVMLWETIVLCVVNRLYFLAKMAELGVNEDDVLKEGRRRASDKFDRLAAVPGLRFVDFGTRRRWSFEHQLELLSLARSRTNGALAGTSNVLLGTKLELPLVGTMAHELPMGMQGLCWRADESADRLQSQRILWRKWETFYEGALTVALPDTYGNDFGLADFEEFAPRWQGLRHDSGDPFEFGEKVIAFYKRLGIEPLTKVLVFSDGLTDRLMAELWKRFHDRIQVSFGWGTHLTNDMGFDRWPDGNRGLKPLSIVMKLIAILIRELIIEAGKVTDNPKKATGSKDTVERLMRLTGYDPSAHQAVECEV